MSSLRIPSKRLNALFCDESQRSVLQEISQLTADGSQSLDGLLVSDPAVQSSPIRLPRACTPDQSISPVVESSPLSPVPRHLDNLVERKLGLEMGTHSWIIHLPKTQRLALAVEKVVARQMSAYKASIRYNVSKTTLLRRLDGGRTHAEAGCLQMKLTLSEQESLISYILFLASLGTPATKVQVGEMAQEMLRRRYAHNTNVHVRSLDGQKLPREYSLGMHWVHRFVKKNTTLSSKLARSMDAKRVQQTNEVVAADFIKKLRHVLQTYNIPPAHIWNMDETGYCIAGNIKHTQRVIVPKTQRIIYTAGASNREWVSIIECVSAAGAALSPYLIFKGKQLQVEFMRWIDRHLSSWSYGVSENGWTDNWHGISWLESFNKCTKRNLASDQWRLLILDGHKSHIQGDFWQYALDNKILLLCLPPHTSHYLQPLDVGVFTHVKRQYNAAVQELAMVGQSALTKRDFIPIYAKLRPQHVCAESIKSGFAQTGIWPTNLEVLRK